VNADPERRMFTVDDGVQASMPCPSVVATSHCTVQRPFSHVSQSDWKLRFGTSIRSSDLIIFEVVVQWFDDRRQRRIGTVETLLHVMERKESQSANFVEGVSELHISLVIAFQSEVLKRLMFIQLRSSILSLLELCG
jgi:hypothetical protein